MSAFGRYIHPYVRSELRAADACAERGDFPASFRQLERAHVLAQASTREHIRVHWRMLLWGVKQRNLGEIAGQILRIAGAASMTAIGLIPHGNTGGTNISPFRRMPIPQDLASILAGLNSHITRRRVIALFIGLILAAGSLTSIAIREDARTAIVDGHRVTFRVVGNGRPALVMISGLGDGMATFKQVARDLGKTAAVIIYDRAGDGGSEAGMGPRDAASAERELSGLLAQSGVEGPFVLVGHSLGGLFAEYYAAQHPDQVSGLILEDSRPADFTRKCQASPDAGMCLPPAWLVWFMPKGARDEAAALAQTMTEVEHALPLKGKPVLVLSRSDASVRTSLFDALWTKAQADLAARYPGSLHITAPAGGHYLHHDQRDWFLESVATLLNQVRTD